MPPQQHILRRSLFIVLSVILTISLVVFILFAPPGFYLDFYALFSPKALSVNNKSVTWQDFKKELELVSFDKTLKTRRQRLERAIDKSIERQLLRQYLATESANFFGQTPFDEYRHLRETVEQRLVDRRIGEYFLVTFRPRDATESGELLRKQAKDQVVTIQSQLKQGKDFKTVYSDAEKNPVIKKLNIGYFLPGMYLKDITRKDFPLQIKSFRDTFFNLKESTVSGILTLSWDDYDRPSYTKVGGEFAYAVIRIDGINRGPFVHYSDWLESQKNKAQVRSFVYIPFFFNWK